MILSDVVDFTEASIELEIIRREAERGINDLSVMMAHEAMSVKRPAGRLDDEACQLIIDQDRALRALVGVNKTMRRVREEAAHMEKYSNQELLLLIASLGKTEFLSVNRAKLNQWCNGQEP